MGRGIQDLRFRIYEFSVPCPWSVVRCTQLSNGTLQPLCFVLPCCRSASITRLRLFFNGQLTTDKGRLSFSDQTSGDLRHTERLVTVASFRTWRGSRTSVAQSPKSDTFCPYSLQL